ncbi:MAG: DoxX family protein [Acidimicrobiales bacterium]
MGVLHLVVPKPFDKIIPRWMPGNPRAWTYASGLWELSSAALLAMPRTRRLGAYVAAATFVAVYPANVQMAIDNAPSTLFGLGLWARLPLQFPMIAWALKHRR